MNWHAYISRLARDSAWRGVGPGGELILAGY